MPIPDLRALQIAAAAIEAGSMSAAAERLGLTQSAVSQAVKRAETQVEARLVHRNRRPLAPTAAGRALVEHLRTIARHAGAALQEIRACGTGPAIGDLRLGMIDTVASTIGPLLIRTLLDDGAAARISAFSGLAPVQAEALLRNEIDVAISSDPMDGHDGLLRFDLFREPYVLICGKAAAESLADRSLPDILAEHDLIRYTERSRMGAHVSRHLRRLRVEQPARLSFDTSDALLAMVAGGLGVAITTPLCLVQAADRAVPLAVLPLPKPGFSREVLLMTRRGEAEAVGARIAQDVRRILRTTLLPQIAVRIPWLASGADAMVLEPDVVLPRRP